MRHLSADRLPKECNLKPYTSNQYALAMRPASPTVECHAAKRFETAPLTAPPLQQRPKGLAVSARIAGGLAGLPAGLRGARPDADDLDVAVEVASEAQRHGRQGAEASAVAHGARAWRLRFPPRPTPRPPRGGDGWSESNGGMPPPPFVAQTTCGV